MRALTLLLLLLATSLPGIASMDFRDAFRIQSLHDTDGLTLAEIRQLPDQDWKEVYEGVHESRFTSKEYWQAAQGAVTWLKITLPRRIETERIWMEIVPNVGIDGQLARFKHNEWEWQLPVGRTADRDRDFPANYLSFNIDTTLEDRTRYLKLSTSQVLHFSLHFRDDVHQQWFQMTSALLNGFVFGFLVLAMAYNLAIGLSANERMYLYYGFYVFSNAVYLAVVSGVDRLFFPEWGGHGSLANLTVLLAIFSGTVFVRELLETQKLNPRMDKALSILQQSLFACMILVNFVSNFAAYILAEIMGLLGPTMLLVAGIISYRSGHRLARYFLVAWSLFLVGAAVWGWMWLGLIEPDYWVLVWLKIGTLFEVTLLSLVLGYRFSHLKKQTESLSEAKTRFQALSETDDLTGVFNRRGFVKMAEKVLRQGKRDLVWLALDIDHFKQFNDQYGHVAGDRLLNEFGNMLATKGRREDLAARLINEEEGKTYRRGVAGRIGGEEFAVLLVDCSLAQARLYAERLLKEFAKIQVQDESGNLVSTTLSIGGTQLLPGDSLENTWKRADQLLYRAKAMGRNQVIME